MRNLLEYPITHDEKVKAVMWAIGRYESDTAGRAPIGDVTGVALQAVLDELTAPVPVPVPEPEDLEVEEPKEDQ